MASEQQERNYVAELESANQLLAAISASISHDLRSPLHTITGFCELYLHEFGPSVSEEGRKLLDRVLEGTHRMDRLLEDLQRFFRLGRQELTKCPVPLDLIVRRVLRSLQAESGGGRVSLQIGSLPECEADPSLIEQVWVNLLGNALKFSRHRNPAIVEVGCLDTPAEWVLFVRDNGAGFDDHYSSKLFGLFQRLHSAAEFEGSGVGLSTVRQIVTRHGGRVWAEGEVDKGAAFFFSLPRGSVV
ncbi:MAG: sensor histidine kinase [Steroidobacteraceae bacterium]